MLACSILLSGAALHAEETDTIATDRPDFTESSNVVGKGRFQFETSVALDRNKANGIKDRTTSTPTLLRFGVSDTFELRVETDGRLVARSDNTGTGTRNTERGTADTSLGVKWHAFDAEGSMPSVGVLAHVDLDSGSAAFRGDGLRPSLRVVAEWELPNDFSFGMMPGFIVDKNANGDRFVAGILGLVVGKAWTERFRTFVELAAPQLAGSGDGGSAAALNVGAAYLLSTTVQLDTALAKGNKHTSDLSWTIGLSAKF